MKTKALLWINFIGFPVSFAILFASFFISHFWWQSVALSLSINSICSLLVFNFVNRIFDKEVERKNEEVLIQQEKSDILKHVKIIEVYLHFYILEYNQLTIPLERRTKEHKFEPIDNTHFNVDFNINDLKTFAQIDIGPNSKITDKIIQRYDITYRTLVDKFEKFLSSCNFKYHQNIYNVTRSIIIESFRPNGIENLLEYCSNNVNDKILPTIVNMCSEYKGNPVEDYNSRTFSGNLFQPIIELYVHLIKTQELLTSFTSEINSLKSTNN